MYVCMYIPLYENAIDSATACLNMHDHYSTYSSYVANVIEYCSYVYTNCMYVPVICNKAW